jgi:purine nucleoside phosphorylase
MLAIIGGTGLYDLAGMQISQEHAPDTPFGCASSAVRQGRLHDREILFLPRHGAGHRLLPHEVNYRANVFALKRAGATQILGFSAVGSLVEAVAPGDFAMPSQYFDWTRGARERVPEAFLAREAQICYATVGIVTDYDCWMDDPAQHVSVTALLERYGTSLIKARQLLDALLATPLPPEEPEIRCALQSALITPHAALTAQQRDWLAVLQR